MNPVEKLKNLDVDRIDMDEAICLSALAKLIRGEYEYAGAEAPAWLDRQIKVLGREIRLRQADFLEKRLAEARARLEVLKPAEVKREALEQEIESLKQRLEQAQ